MDFRYLFEHELLPKAVLAEKGKKLIILIAQDSGGVLADFMDSIGSKIDNNYHCPYSAEDFAVVNRTFDRSDYKPRYFIHRVVMPEPQFPPQCYCVYICHDADFANVRYYTLEKSADDARFLCGWTKNGTHLNYGPTDEDPDELTKLLADWYYDEVSQ